MRYKANVLWKALAFWGVFLTLYAVYKFFPIFPLSLICGVTESNFQHYKAGFFSYLIVNLVEYAWNHRKITDRESFIFSRLSATILLPWIIFLLWYIAPALIGRWPNNVLEIVYANVITFVVGLFTVILESGLESVPYNRSLKVVLVTLFLASIMIYIVFTFRLPWADVFVEPDWR
jgi:hypothetical protein